MSKHQRDFVPRGESPLRAFGLSHQRLQRGLIDTRIDVVFVHELLADKVDDSVGPVDSAEVDISGRAECREAVPLNFHQRDIERATTEVVNKDRFFVARRSVELHEALLNSVRNRSRRRLVENVEHVEPGHSPGVFGGFPSRLIKIRRYGDDRFFQRANLQFRIVAQLLQDERLNGLRRKRLTADAFVVRHAAHVTLRKLCDAFGFKLGRLRGFLPDDNSRSVKENHARCREVAFGVHDRRRTTRRVDPRDERIGRPEVDADNRFSSFGR